MSNPLLHQPGPIGGFPSRNLKTPGSGSFPMRPALGQPALPPISPAIRREIDAKVKRFVHERLSEALRRGGNGHITIRL